MSFSISQTSKFHVCPSCKRNVRPDILEHIPAFPNATPPVPARLRVECMALMQKPSGAILPCREEWYIPEHADAD